MVVMVVIVGVWCLVVVVRLGGMVVMVVMVIVGVWWCKRV